MSYRTKLLLFNNFIQTLDEDLQLMIDEFIGNDYNMDNSEILSSFGLEAQFSRYIEDMYGYAA